MVHWPIQWQKPLQIPVTRREALTLRRLIRCRERRRIRIERHDVNPTMMTLSAGDNLFLVETPYGDQVVFAAYRHVFTIRRPADAQQASEVTTSDAHQLHGVVMENAKETVLRDDGQVQIAGGEGELIYTTIFGPDDPSVKRVAGTFRFANMNGVTFATFK